jgi:branched-subunit amino acid aminotransferase/4-amino-4-deoxychorismate lyase
MDAAAGWICVNGGLFEPKDATVSVLDSGFLLGDGLFESLRATEGRPYLLNRHLRRLFGAAADYEFQNMPSVETVSEWVYGTLDRAALAEAYVRITVTRGCGAVGLAPPEGPPTVVVAVLPIGPPSQADDAVAVTLLPPAPHCAASAKSTSWQHMVLARRMVEKAGADEGIRVSEVRQVLEAVASNIFVVIDEQLLTPPTEQCLPGITRARAIELGREHGIPVREAPVEVGALMQADEVFLTNSVQGLRAVERVNGSAVGDPVPGSMFATLHTLYEQDRLGIVQGLT